MANTVSTQTLLGGPRNYVVKVVIVSDGTNLSDTVLVDASALGLPVDGSYRLERFEFSTSLAGGNNLIVEWDGATDAPIVTLPGGVADDFDWCKIGGVKNNATTPTGDITATGTLTANDVLTFIFYIVK